MKGRTILRSKYVWDGKSEKSITDGAVLIENGIVQAVGRAQDILTAVHEQVHEWPNATLLPGLIDSHTHLSMDGSMENYLDHMTDSIAQLTLRATAMMHRDLTAGITTCRCLGDREFIDIACRQAVDAGDIEGPRLLVATRGIRAPHGHGFVGYPFDGSAEISKAIKENIEHGADLTKIYISGTLKGNGDLPSYLRREEIELAIEDSHEAGVPVASHCVGGVGLDWALELRLDTLEHAYHITAQQVENLAKSQTALVLTPGAVLSEKRVHNLPVHLIKGHLDERDAMFKAMALTVAAGIPFAVGSDGLHGELVQDLLYLTELGASNIRALQAACCQGAKIIGVDDETGSLDVGKFADIIVVDGDPLKDLHALKQIRAVFKKGRCMFNRRSDGLNTRIPYEMV